MVAIKSNNNSEIDSNVQQKCLDFIRHAEAHQMYIEQRDRAVLNEDFYRGAHWTEAEWNAYKDLGITPIKINRCLAAIKTITGMQVQNKQDIGIRPRLGGSETAAKVHTEVFKHAQDLADADFVYSDFFRKGCVYNTSWLGWDTDEDRNINGQLTFNSYGFFSVICDPDAIEYDLNKSAKYVIQQEWQDKDKTEMLYPDLANGNFSAASDVSDELLDYLMSGYNAYYEESTKKYRYKIRRVWWKEYKQALVVSDMQQGVSKIITDSKLIAEAKSRAKTLSTVKVKSTVATILHKTTMIGSYTVEDKKNPFGDELTDFPFVRFAPHFDDGYAMGILDNVIDINREENINRTQATRYLNQTVNSGWIVGDDNNKAAMKELQNYGAVNGVILAKNKYGNSLEKILPNPLPAGHIMNSEQSANDFKEVTGLNDAVQGYDTGKAESGRAISLKQKQGMMSAETIFDNFYRSLQLFGNMVFKAMRKMKIYTDDEIRKIVGESNLLDAEKLAEARAELVNVIGSDLPQPMPITPPNPQMMAQVKPEDMPAIYDTIKVGMKANQMYAKQYPTLDKQWNDVIKQEAIEKLMSELSSDDMAEYQVKVCLSPNAPTVKMANFMEMAEIQDKYNIIPPDVFIQNSNLSPVSKDQILSKIKQQQAQAITGAA